MSWGRWLTVAAGALIAVVIAWFAFGRDSGPDDQAGSTDASTGTGAASEQGSDDTGGADAAGGARADGEGCGPVTVWASPEVGEVVVEAAERAAEDTDGCARIEVVDHEPVTESDLAGSDLPQVWIPDSAAWPEVLLVSGDQGAELTVAEEPLASSPVVLAGAPATLEALAGAGVGPEATWSDLVGVYQQMAADPEGPSLELRVGDARTDPATMSLLASTGADLEGEAAEANRTLAVGLAQSATEGDPMAALVAAGQDGQALLVPATEAQVVRARADGEEVAALAPADGLGVVRVPFVTVGSPEETATIAALEEQLRSADAEVDWAGAGLRAGADGPAPEGSDLPDDVVIDAADPDPEAVAGMHALWAGLAPQSRLLTVIDISGSMDEVVGGGTTRIDLTREATQAALSRMPDGTAVGLWHFSTELDGDRGYREVVPVRSLGEAVEDATQREVLFGATSSFGTAMTHGDTALHDTVWAAYEAASQDQAEQLADGQEAISTALILTDGINDNPGGGMSEQELIERLTQAHEEAEQPIVLVLLGMGPDVDEAALQRIAEAGGGRSLVIRDPRELPQVFVDIVLDRVEGAR